jgi:hypothetical protein
MAVDAQAVQIVINVTDANSGAVVSGVTQNIQKIGAAGAGVQGQMTASARSFQQFGTSGTIAGRVVKQSLDEAGASAMTAREKTHLLTEELGIRLPRAFRGIIAESKMAQTVLTGLTGAMMGLAAIQIGGIFFEALTSGVEKLWHSMTGLSDGTQAYLDEVEKTRNEDFGNARSIEDTRMRIDQASESIKGFRKQAEEATGETLGWRRLPDLIAPGLGRDWQRSHERDEADDAAAKGQTQVDKLQHIQEGNQFHEQRAQMIDLLHLKDGQLSKEKQITAETEHRTQTAGENRRFDREQDRILGNPVSPDAGASVEALAISSAKVEAETKLFILRKEQSQELAHMREAALEAGLRGSALYHAQEAFAIQDLKSKKLDSITARSYIYQKFHNEEMKRLEDQRIETEKIERSAAMAGLTGIARTQAEGANKVHDLNVDKTLDDYPEERAKRVAASQRETNAQIADEQRAFSEQVDSIVEQSQSRQISGFARIRAEAEKAANSLQKQFDKVHENMDLTQPGAENQLHQDTNQLGRGLDAIRTGADRQAVDLQARNTEETEQIESAARAKMLSAEQQQTAAIGTEYEQRLRKFQEELNQQEISQNDYNRRVVAAGELRDAEMVEAAKRAREKMAGEFTRFFKDPLGSMKEMGEKAAGEAAAAAVQRLQARYGHTGTTAHASTPGGLFDGILGRITGQPHAPGTTPGVPGQTHSPDLVSSKSISLGTAQIHIQSASLTLGGSTSAAGAGPRSVPGASNGSTSLMTIPGSSFNASGGSTASPSGFGGGTVGGAGDVGFAGGGTQNFTGSGSAPQGGGNGIGTALGDIQQGMGLVKGAAGIFGGGKDGGGGSDATGAAGAGKGMGDIASSIFGSQNGTASAAKNGGMLGGGGVMSNIGGAAGGAMGLFSAYEGNGGIGGALGGAMSGMQLGMAVGGPIGAAIGLAAGAVIGAIGFGGREKARVYDLKQVRPRLANDIDGYQQGSMDYLSAYSDMRALDQEARKTLDAMGGAARGYYWDTINKEIGQAEGKLTAEQRAGRSQFTESAAQYDQGGWTGGFGSMATGPDSGWAHMRANEFVVNEQPAADHAGALEAIRSGASHSDMANYYGAGGGASMPAAQNGFGGDIHLHYNVVDSKGIRSLLSRHKHDVRAALNESYSENSGGSDA